MEDARKLSKRLNLLTSVRDEVVEITSIVEDKTPQSIESTINYDESHPDFDRVIIEISGGIPSFESSGLDELYEVTEWDKFEIKRRSLSARIAFEINE